MYNQKQLNFIKSNSAMLVSILEARSEMLKKEFFDGKPDQALFETIKFFEKFILEVKTSSGKSSGKSQGKPERPSGDKVFI